MPIACSRPSSSGALPAVRSPTAQVSQLPFKSAVIAGIDAIELRRTGQLELIGRLFAKRAVGSPFPNLSICYFQAKTSFLLQNQEKPEPLWPLRNDDLAQGKAKDRRMDEARGKSGIGL